MPRLVVPRGAIHPNQLHEELLAAFPVWRQTLRVESTPTELRLTLPGEADIAAVESIIAAHVPGRSQAEQRQDRIASERAKRPDTLLLTDRVRRLEIILGLD